MQNPANPHLQSQSDQEMQLELPPSFGAPLRPSLNSPSLGPSLTPLTAPLIPSSPSVAAATSAIIPPDWKQDDQIEVEVKAELPSEPDFDTPDLLDSFALETVLSIAKAITPDCLEELELLGQITDAQKQQVWAVMDESLQDHLIKLKLISEPSWLDKLDDDEDDDGDALNSPDIPEHPVASHAAVSSPLRVGDRVVLYAHPHLKTPELIAIWQIVAIRGTYATLSTEGMKTRTYLLSWLALYLSSSN